MYISSYIYIYIYIQHSGSVQLGCDAILDTISYFLLVANACNSFGVLASSIFTSCRFRSRVLREFSTTPGAFWWWSAERWDLAGCSTQLWVYHGLWLSLSTKKLTSGEEGAQEIFILPLYVYCIYNYLYSMGSCSELLRVSQPSNRKNQITLQERLLGLMKGMFKQKMRRSDSRRSPFQGLPLLSKSSSTSWFPRLSCRSAFQLGSG